MDPATIAALTAALPALAELIALLAKAVAGQQVDPAAIKAALAAARVSTGAAVVALDAEHAAARAKADEDLTKL